MNIKQIQHAIQAGKSVTDVAILAGKTPSAIYMALRRAGTPAASLRPSASAKKYREIPDRPGYRAGSNGVIQSCVSQRTGDLTDDWRDLSIQRGTRGGYYVQLGSSGAGRRRISLRNLLIEAWGEADGERIFERVRREMG